MEPSLMRNYCTFWHTGAAAVTPCGRQATLQKETHNQNAGTKVHFSSQNLATLWHSSVLPLPFNAKVTTTAGTCDVPTQSGSGTARDQNQYTNSHRCLAALQVSSDLTHYTTYCLFLVQSESILLTVFCSSPLHCDCCDTLVMHSSLVLHQFNRTWLLADEERKVARQATASQIYVAFVCTNYFFASR